jgi:hypothetical protein
MTQIIDNKITVLVAKKGGGKSYQLRKLLSRERKTVVVFDVRAEYDDLMPNVITVEDDSEDALENALEELEDCIRWSAKTGEITGVSFIPFDPENDVEEFCRLLFQHFNNLVIAFEEVPAYTLPGSMPSQMERIVLQARHKRHDLYFVGQRYAEMPRSLTAQADFHCIGSTKEPRDLEALAARITAEGAQKVIELEPRQWIHVFVLGWFHF